MTLRPPDMRAPYEARVGQTLARKWHLDRLIDVGGMGAVFAATHRNGRRAAIKVLHPHFASNAEVRRRFLREGYVANRIDHPGAVAIVDDDVAEDGSPFLVMELLEGDSLSGLISLRGGVLHAGEALAIAGQVLEVLAVAHDRGIVHRDIKPANVFVTRSGHAKLLDFGLARIRDGAVSLIPTAAGVVMGTAGYMAPEQARGQPDQIDARSDLFSVGAVLYRALSGRRIHEKPNAVDMTIAAMKDPAPSLATVLPGAPPALVRAVDGALAFDKAARFQDARTMFEALRAAYAAVGGRPAGAPATTPSTQVAPPLPEASSLVVEVAFGDDHDEALARETLRAQGVVDALSAISITVPSEEGERK